MRPTYYELLGVPNTATTAVIEQAYRKQNRIWHPDKVITWAQDNQFVGCREVLNQIHLAYQTLTDDNARTKYDTQLKLSKVLFNDDDTFYKQWIALKACYEAYEIRQKNPQLQIEYLSSENTRLKIELKAEKEIIHQLEQKAEFATTLATQFNSAQEEIETLKRELLLMRQRNKTLQDEYDTLRLKFASSQSMPQPGQFGFWKQSKFKSPKQIAIGMLLSREAERELKYISGEKKYYRSWRFVLENDEKFALELIENLNILNSHLKLVDNYIEFLTIIFEGRSYPIQASESVHKCIIRSASQLGCSAYIQFMIEENVYDKYIHPNLGKEVANESLTDFLTTTFSSVDLSSRIN